MISSVKGNEKEEPNFDNDEVELNKFQNVIYYKNNEKIGNGTLFVTTR